MKIGFVGCVESSFRALKTLLTLAPEGIEVVGVVTRSSSKINSDFFDLTPLCEENAIPYHFEDPKNRSASREFMRNLVPDIIYCFGWSYLLDERFLSLAPKGVIGFHPAKLPQNRGRHPIIWALALGLKETASSFFRMDADADSGPLLSQVDVTIEPEYDAASLYEKILVTAERQIVDFTFALAKGDAKFIEQDHASATYWRKRSRNDGLIDWRMTAESIHNLIRALARPYPGAEFTYDGAGTQVWSSRVSSRKYPINIEPGFVLDVVGDSILVKCAGSGAIWLTEVEQSIALSKGHYL